MFTSDFIVAAVSESLAFMILATSFYYRLFLLNARTTTENIPLPMTSHYSSDTRNGLFSSILTLTFFYIFNSNNANTKINCEYVID
jgi:hypothetical protein